jgi:pimeloyl-ACP methyl ester carboxylesterase
LDHLIRDAPFDVVLVHGAGGNNLLWSRMVQHLSGGAKALAVNLPGHPSGEITCRSVSEYSEALNSFIMEAGVNKPVVCGHSMGGAVALTLAIEHPEAVGGLILVSTGAKLGVDPKIIEGLRGQPMKAIEQAITPRSFYSIDLGLGREARAALSVSNLSIFLNDYLACQGFDVRASLGKITVRTLVVCGDHDQMTPPKWAHYLHENILGSELNFVKDSGHMVPLEKPEPLGRLIQGFLSTLSP